MISNLSIVIGMLILGVLAPSSAFAYVGPGTGLGVIGTVIALIGAIIMGIVGFVWYPIKRLLHSKKSTEPEVDDSDSLETEIADPKASPEAHE